MTIPKAERHKSQKRTYSHVDAGKKSPYHRTPAHEIAQAFKAVGWIGLLHNGR